MGTSPCDLAVAGSRAYWTDPIDVSRTRGNGDFATMDPAVVIDSRDVLHLVWKDAEPGNKEIFYRTYADGVWSDPPANVSRSQVASDRPAIGLDAGERPYLAWSEKTDGVHFGVVWSSLRDGAWTDPSQLSDADESDRTSRVVPSRIAGDRSVVLWTETSGPSANASVRARAIALRSDRSNQEPPATHDCCWAAAGRRTDHADGGQLP